MNTPELRLRTVAKHAVLAGAGLSKNWGGYLASEMWSAILSHRDVETDSALHQALLRQTDFETVIAEVRREQTRYTTDSTLRLERAVSAAFELQDENICHALRDTQGYEAWRNFASRLLYPLAESPRNKSGSTFLFTLNQDILIERAFNRPTEAVPSLPGLPPSDTSLWFRAMAGDWNRDPFLLSQHGIRVPEAPPDHIDFVASFNYVKLHGSFNWRAGDGDEGVMVLGGAKLDDISRFWILSAYLNLFRRICLEHLSRLMIVGYGFRDRHVNDILEEAVRTKGLRLIVVDPRPVDDFRREILVGPHAALWGGIVGFFGRPLREYFGGAYPSGEATRLREAFLREV